MLAKWAKLFDIIKTMTNNTVKLHLNASSTLQDESVCIYYAIIATSSPADSKLIADELCILIKAHPYSFCLS